MSHIPYHVARAFLDGTSHTTHKHHARAGNFQVHTNTRKPWQEYDDIAKRFEPGTNAAWEALCKIAPGESYTILYTYEVPLAVRTPAGHIVLPCRDNGMRAHDIKPTVPNLFCHYSFTSDRHQKALQVEMGNRWPWRVHGITGDPRYATTKATQE